MTTEITRPTQQDQPPTAAPRLAPGLELLGKYEGSGFKEPPYLIRRADGQIVTLPPLLYVAVEELSQGGSLEEVADRISHRVKRGLEPNDLFFLVESKLGPLGLIAGQERMEGADADPLLALKLRTAVIPKRLVRFIAAAFSPLFFPVIVLAALAALVAVDAWLFFGHGVAQSLRELVYQPLLILGVFAVVVISAAFHESGHAAACRYGGAEPGEMGVGLYVVWPAFYTDVTDSYRLGKGGRLRVDLGGVYFNTLFILATIGVYALTGIEALLLIVVVQHFEIIRQLLPIVRLDGYYLLADVTGVPDLFARMGPILRSLVPWRESDPKVGELKVWPRVVVTVWVLLVIPLLALQLAIIVVHAPRIVATAWDSLGRLWGSTSAGFGEGRPAQGAVGVVQMLTLLLPMAAIAFTSLRVGRRVSRSAWRGTEGRPILRGGVVAAVVAGVAFVAVSWFPDGDYTPIAPNERWTFPETVSAVAATATGSSALSGSTETTSTPGTGTGDTAPLPTQTPVAEESGATTSPASSPSPEASISPSPNVSPSPTTSP